MPVQTSLANMMTSNVVTVEANQPLLHACQIMSRDNISCVVVMAPEAPKKPIGLISERRIVQFINEHPIESIGHFPIVDLLGDPLHTLNCNSSLIEAIRMCQQHRIRHVVVINDSGELSGIVSFTDIIEQVMAHSNQETALANSTENTSDSFAEVMRRLAFTDPLTGISNRRAMDLDLEHQWEIAKRYERDFSIVMLDVDYFKLYNDHYGHLAGDEVLVKVTKEIGESIRSTDRLFRFGGEEFCLMLPETSNENALILAERIVEAIKALDLTHEHSTMGVVTISGGIASLNSTRNASKEELLHNADRALYEAKRLGRNRVIPETVLQKTA